jgi:hypothetical protein
MCEPGTRNYKYFENAGNDNKKTAASKQGIGFTGYLQHHNEWAAP